LSGDCTELVEDCRNIREELFKQLSYVENLELNMVQNLLSLIVNAVTIVLTFFGIALSLSNIFSNFSNIPNVPAMQAIANILTYVVFLAGLIWLYRHHMEPTKSLLNSRVEVIRGLRLEHIDALKEYLNKLKSCCELLCEQECASRAKSVCADLENLEVIVRHLGSREQRTTTSILKCLLNLMKQLIRRSPKSNE